MLKFIDSWLGRVIPADLFEIKQDDDAKKVIVYNTKKKLTALVPYEYLDEIQFDAIRAILRGIL